MHASSGFDVVILTEQRYLNPLQLDDYALNVLSEDDLVRKALESKGLKVTRLSWDDPDFDWSDTKSVLFRSTWDYFDRFEEFSTWLDRVSRVTRLINSEKLIRWNMDKHYFLEIAEKGTQIIPTRYIEKDERIKLTDLIEETGWNKAILKPCISGGARHTYRLNPANAGAHQKQFEKLIKEEAFMLQPFIDSIVEQGELSVMVINGKFTHSVLKKAKPGDFSVQDDWGGTLHAYKPAADEIHFAENAVKNCPEKPAYARVDIAKGENGEPLLVELELIEPELWFRRNPEAAKELAEAVLKIL